MAKIFGKKIKVLSLVGSVSSIFLIIYGICKNLAYLGLGIVLLINSIYLIQKDIKCLSKENKQFKGESAPAKLKIFKESE